MPCSCNHCGRFVKVTSIATTDNQVTLTADRSFTLTNESPLCFAICTVIPPLSATLPVVLVIGSTTISLKDRAGEPLLANLLKNRFLYRGFYGTTGPQLVIHNMPKVCCCDRFK